MKRGSKFITWMLAANLMLGGVFQQVVRADDKKPSDADAVRALGDQEIALLKKKAEELVAQGKTEEAIKLLREAQMRQAETAGAAGRLESATRAMDREDELARSEAERNREMYKKPGFWDKVGDKAVDIVGGLIKGLLDKWLAGGGKDDELLDQIKNLQDERDRLMNERNDTGDGLGRIITDSNGNYGYDRDGDGVVDIPLDSNNNPGNFDPSNDAVNDVAMGPDSFGGASSSVPDLSRDDRFPPSFGGSGGVSAGSGLGAFPMGGGGAASALPAQPGAAGDKKDAEKDKLAGGSSGTGGKSESGSMGSGGGKGGKDGGTSEELGAEVKEIRGRVLILPKLEFEDLAGDKKAKTSGWKDEWENDGWNDAKDNGDKAKKKGDWAADENWGDEWDDSKKRKKDGAGAGSTKPAADEKQKAELVDQIIRVETKIAEWRKVDKKKKTGEDAYAFSKDEMSGYKAAGSEPKKDPFKDVRDKDGKLDLTKVDIWLVEKETWKEDEEPKRYRLKLDPDAGDFDPIDGGYMIVKGTLKELTLDEKVLKEIKGEVKLLDVKKVLISSEKPPEESSDAASSEKKDKDGKGSAGGSTGAATPAPGSGGPEHKPAPAPSKKKGEDDWGDDW